MISAAGKALLRVWLVAAVAASLDFLPVNVMAADRKPLDIRASEAVAKLPMQGRLPAANRMDLAIGLPLRNQEALKTLLQQVQDRRSANFHRYLTPAQFAAQFGPTEKDYQRVQDWARSNRLAVVRTFAHRALVEVSGSVADIETTFQVHLGNYRHPTEDRQFYAPDVKPTVPAALPVLYVRGLDNYEIPHPNGHEMPLDNPAGPEPMGGSGINGLYFGSDFRNAYVPGTSLTGAGQVVGMVEFDGYTPGDIQAYETLANLPSVPLVNVLASYAPGGANKEVASDIELAIAMAPGLAAVNVYEGNNDDVIIGEIANPSKGETLPMQVSCSWGIGHDDSIAQGLQQLAAQGQTFFYAAGDSGAYTNGTYGGTAESFAYMTDVGGTQLFMSGSGASWQSEHVWDDNPGTNFQYFSSTGGVMTQLAIPDYQKRISMGLNQGSTVYRNVPDVALVARDIFIVYTGSNPNGSGYTVTGAEKSWVGTSAAAPLWAGICALVNQQAAAQGKPSAGFLNPAIYAIAQGSSYAPCFHDITSGSNAWSNPNGTSSLGLYPAARGYDLCTGWGTPNTTALITALVSLSGPVFVDFNYTGPANGGASDPAGSYDYPFPTLAQGVSAVKSGGTIIIKTAGSSSETMKISKPMKIIASDGAASIGK